MIENPVIGIVGGTGLMGNIFKKFFEASGLKVQIASISTKLSIEECASTSDVVIISVPIGKTIDVIKKTAPLVKESGLIMDFTSLKKEPVKAMLTYAKSSVIGAHPLFGPGLNDIKNQVIVLCPARGEEWFDWIKNLFIKGMAKIKICSPDEHDKMMSVIQGLMHFTSITVSHVLKELGIDIKESMEFASPIYKLRLNMVGRILNQDPDLYANIEILNPETVNVLKSYIDSSKNLFKIVKNKKVDKFVDYFNEAADYLGDFKKTAEDESNYIIDMLVNKPD